MQSMLHRASFRADRRTFCSDWSLSTPKLSPLFRNTISRTSSMLPWIPALMPLNSKKRAGSFLTTKNVSPRPYLAKFHVLNYCRYTVSYAFFEALWELGVGNCFVNLGSNHHSIMEARAKGLKEKSNESSQVFTCPNEVVALSMADGYPRVTNKPKCVIIHVDVGTSGLGAAIHNASIGQAPVLIFAGLSPFTIEGELRGPCTEYI